MLWRFLSVLCVTIYSFIGGVFGFVVLTLWGDTIIAEDIAKHGGDDGGGSGTGLGLFWGLPVGLIIGLVVGLAITGGHKRKLH
jgi:hypothetical protein